MEKAYRRFLFPSHGVVFEVQLRQTDLWIWATENLRKEAQEALLEARMHIEGYIEANPEFMESHLPLPMDPTAPPIVREMLRAAKAAGVGPMASVAGAIAQFVGLRLLEQCSDVMVENGGDLFMRVTQTAVVAVYAGDSPLSGRVGLKIQHEDMPIAVCTSSATVGHSWSYGVADAAVVVANDAPLADAAATALCNMTRNKEALDKLLEWALEIDGVRGALIIVDDVMAAKGGIEIVPVDLTLSK
jgi:hypothetical protein